MNITDIAQVPRPGMFATVRNRRGIVSAVEPFDGQEGRLHLVHLDYKDDQLPAEERRIFCPRPDVFFMHLSHPMLQRALAALTRRRFPGGGEEVSRWTVRRGDLPPGAEALVLLSIEELAVNELRETFHHWVRTLLFPIRGGVLGAPLAHRPARELRRAAAVSDDWLCTQARDLLDEIAPDLKRLLAAHAVRLTANLKSQLETTGVQALRQEEDRYRSRQGEGSTLIAENTLGKLDLEKRKHFRRSLPMSWKALSTVD